MSDKRSERTNQEPWNREYYVSYGGPERSWEEARQYGFVSGGGGEWYIRSLVSSPGDRIWVRPPARKMSGKPAPAPG